MKANPLIALAIRDFRMYWCGLASQVIGLHMFQFTLGWLAFEISRSQGQLALINFCAFIPQVTLTLLGGVLADRIDARKLIAMAQSVAAAGVAVVIGMYIYGLLAIWHLALASFMIGLSSAIDEPTRAILLGAEAVSRARSRALRFLGYRLRSED